MSAYSLNVALTTILFLVIFITGTAWTLAVNKSFEKKPQMAKYWLFALGMTLFTVGAAIGIGELGNYLKENINVNLTSLLGADI